MMSVMKEEIDLKKKHKRPNKGRVFQCTGYPGCNMSFTRSEHLARHKRKHTGERPFTCPYCSKNFSRLDNLRQHKQTVHAYENYLDAKKEEDTPDDSKDNTRPHRVHNIEVFNNTHFENVYSNSGNNSTNSTNSADSTTNATPNEKGFMVSPPNSNSPHHNYPYFRYQNLSQQRHKENIEEKTKTRSFEDANLTRDSLKLPSHGNDSESESKPKRRPRPLSLQHSFISSSDKLSATLSSFSSNGSSNNATPSYSQHRPPIQTAYPRLGPQFSQPPNGQVSQQQQQQPQQQMAYYHPYYPNHVFNHQELKSAPPVPLYSFSQQMNQAHSIPRPVYSKVLPYSNDPKSMVSPLSPLFYQSNPSHHLNGELNKSTNYKSPITLPPMSRGYHRPSDSLGANETDTSTNTTPIKFSEIKGRENTKTWLKGVLNDDHSGTTVTQTVASSIIDNGPKSEPIRATNDGKNGLLNPINEPNDIRNDKVPSINNLLSPYTEDKFPNDK